MEKELGMADKIIRSVFGILFLLVCLVLFAGEFFGEPEHIKETFRCEEFRADWVQVKDSGERIPVKIPGRCEAERGERVVIETVLPEQIEDGMSLCFRGARQDMQVYIDGELRKEFSTQGVRQFGKSSAAVYLFVQLNPEDAGKVLAFAAKTDSPYSGVVNPIYYGDRMTIWNYFSRSYGAELIIACILFLLGIATLASTVAFRIIYKKKIILSYLGWGILLASMWVIGNSAYRQLVFPRVTTVSDLTFCIIILMPIPFLFYMNSVQKGRYKTLYHLVEAGAMAEFFILTILHMAGIVDFTDSFICMAIICFLAIALMAATILWDAFHGQVRDYILIAVGISGVCLAGIGQIVLYLQRTIPFNGALISAGLMFLLATAVINTGRDALRIEREKSQAVLASEAKAHFLASMSHEIRTPINAVLGMDEMILRESTEEEIIEYALDIRSAGRSLLSLVNDILDFSKIESGKLKIVLADYELSSLINDCYSMILMRAKDKNLDFIVKTEPTLPEALKGDEVRVRQVIINLLTNAVKYTQEGHVLFSVGGEYLADGRYGLKITVEDTGRGISDEDKEKLFLSFERLEEERNRHIEGTGLGLSITKKLVDLMEGDISLESTYGVGSTFVVKIPQEVAVPEPLGDFSISYKEEQRILPDVAEEFYAPQGRVLVVDDMEMNRKVFQGLLKGTGLTIDAAESGEQCLVFVREQKYHVIFLDHMMPGMDGIETLRQMRQLEDSLNQDTPVIMLTANAVLGAREQYLKEGFTDYISKPVKTESLQQVLLKYLPEELLQQRRGPMPAAQEDSGERQERDEGQQENGEMDLTERKLRSLSLIDTESGVAYCGGNTGFYLEVLQAFWKGNRLEELERSFLDGDLEQYRIYVHGIKSTALSIGAAELSGKAKEMEQAAKEGNEEYLRAQHAGMMELYREIIGQIEKVIQS